ncbi:MAG: hypothetical protein QOF87_4287 [Pseudonocardiales bacterium]|nr:hypothetical protein [Pseudonocardiales bacterium]
MAEPGHAADGFVGRGAPRQRILAAHQESLARGARLVLVSGEAGIGKTSLLAEATRDMTQQAASVAWGTCWDAERAPGYWPWVQVLRVLAGPAGDLATEVSDADRAELGRLVPEMLPDTVAAAEMPDSDRARFRLFDAVARCLERVARHQPLVVVIDDLQWADSSSLWLLDFVVRAHRPVPLLLLGAYRHDELRADTAQLLAGLGSRADHIRLGGLSPAEVRALIAGTSGTDVAERWGADVHRRSGGHPFLVRELAYTLTTQPPESASAPAVPGAVHDLIVGRIHGLTPDCQRLLDAAAAGGNDIHIDVLADVLTLTPSAIATQVEEAIRAGVLSPAAQPGQARFAHDLYRETIYADLATPARLSLHQSFGAALERRHQRGGTVFAGEVARHFTAAAAVDGPDRAIRWALLAGREDRDRLAFSEAAAQLARVRIGLDAAAVHVPGDQLVDLLASQADAESRAGEPARARELLREAHAGAVRIDDPERLAAVALGLQRIGARFAMPRDEVIAFLEEARTAVAGQSPALEAQVSASLARELHHSIPRDRARALPMSQHALALARGLDDPSTLAACLLARHDVLWTPGTGAERIDVAREIVALAERSGDVERRSEGLLLAANALLETGSPGFRDDLDAFLDLESRLGQPRHDYLALTRRAALAIMDGSLEEGERLVFDAAALGDRIGEPDTGNVRMSQLLELARARGEPGQLRATAELAVAWWVGVPSHAHAVAAGLLAEAGDLDGARRHLDTVLELGIWHQDHSYLWSVFVGGLTVTAARLADHSLSRQLLAELTPLAASCGVNGAVVCFMGSHAHWAGVAAASIGQIDDAKTFLLRAATVHRRLGARAWEAASCAELALLLKPAEAAVHRQRATALAVELSLFGVAKRLNISLGDVTAAPADGSVTAALCRDSDLWHIAYRGRTAQVRDVKGLRDLAALLSRPGQDVHVLDLVASAIGTRDRTDPVLDSRARAEFRRRIGEVDDDLAEAETHHDLERITVLKTERDALYAELRHATGHAGKDRGLGPDTVERARKAVTARIRDSIRRIAAALPELGTHLDRSITTGTFCRYEPTDLPIWDLHVRPR